MIIKKYSLLTTLISFFILGACNDPSTVGLDIDEEILLNSDTISQDIVTKLLKEDSVVTNYTDRSTVAYMNDAIFGETTTNVALGVTSPSNSLKFDATTVLDSAVLVLPYSTTGALYGDSSSYTLEVRQLDEETFKSSTSFIYNTKAWKVKSQVVATKTFSPAYRDSIYINEIRTGKADTIQKVIPQLRIVLDKAFIKENILDLDSATLSSSDAFAKAFKGLYLSINKNAVNSNGAAISFDTYTSGATRIDLFYKKTSTTGTIDTTSTAMPISGSSGNAATEIKWTKSTVVDGELASSSTNNENLYIKGLFTKFKVSFPDVKKVLTLGSDIAINRAELILPVEESSIGSFQPLGQLRIHRWDIANQPAYVPDESSSDPRYLGPGFVGGYYNSKIKAYIFNITGYVQDLAKGKTTDYGTFVTSFDYLNPTASSTTSSTVLRNIGRSQIVGGGSVGSSRKAKLKIYYSDLK